MRVRWLRNAPRNLDEEASFIASDNSVAARLVVERVLEAVAQLARATRTRSPWACTRHTGVGRVQDPIHRPVPSSRRHCGNPEGCFTRLGGYRSIGRHASRGMGQLWGQLAPSEARSLELGPVRPAAALRFLSADFLCGSKTSEEVSWRREGETTLRLEQGSACVRFGLKSDALQISGRQREHLRRADLRAEAARSRR